VKRKGIKKRVWISNFHEHYSQGHNNRRGAEVGPRITTGVGRFALQESLLYRGLRRGKREGEEGSHSRIIASFSKPTA
jgi:hypothetical protein